MNLVTRALLALLGLAATVLIAAAGAASAAWYYLSPGLPSAATMREVKLQVPLKIYSRDGRLIAQLGEFRRIPVAYDQIPPVVVQAFLAAEDDRFFEHPGFDYQGILRAGINFALTGDKSQGGSTITQQLARAYFLSSERTFLRKAKEILLAMQIEHAFSKQEILALYLNKIFLGQRAYGVAAAAEVYYGKSLDQLSVAEAATIAGIPKAPSVLNPVSDPVRARERRGYVLRRMLELRSIDDAAFQAAIDSPVEARLHGPRVELDAPYIAEMVRSEMVARYGPAAYTDGFRVTTTIDSRLQRYADNALRTALLEYDRRHGYRGPLARNALPAGVRDDAALQQVLNGYPTHPDLYPAVVLSLDPDNAATFYVHDIGRLKLPWTQIRWRPWLNDADVGPAPQAAGDVVQPGDVVYLLRTVNRGWLLAQLPAAQGALVALDPLDGATVALAGGYDFFASKFNRAIQAKRQPGSSFKPFIYSAALEHGFTAATLVNDAPMVFANGGADEVWRPENNSGSFGGPTRLREGLVKSLNLVSIRVLLHTGINETVQYIKPFGFPDSVMPRNPTMALGSGAASPREMAAGFAGFASGGYRVEPYLIERIEDSDGQVVFQADPPVVCRTCEDQWYPGTGPAGDPTGSDGASAATVAAAGEAITDASELAGGESVVRLTGKGQAPRIITPENDYIMYDMMRDVIRRGTGRRALALGRSDIAGKTGTSNDRRDTWFSGFNSELVATAWIGFDQERSLGPREEGSRTALPMWIYFMNDALRGVPESPLPRPPGLVTARISPETGRLEGADSPDGIFELFRESDLARLGTEAPGEGASGAPGSGGGNVAEIF